MRNNYKMSLLVSVLILALMIGYGPIKQQADGSAIGNAKSISNTTTQWPRSESEIEILYCWGVECRNRVDTVSGTITKDLIADPAITVPFEFAEDQKNKIVALADSIGIWHWPNSLFNADFEPGGLVDNNDPCNKYVLQINNRGRIKTLVWDTCTINSDNPSPFREKINPLRKLIEKMVMESETYKALPEKRGGYI